MVRIGGLGIHYRAFSGAYWGSTLWDYSSGLKGINFVAVWNRESHSTAKLFLGLTFDSRSIEVHSRATFGASSLSLSLVSQIGPDSRRLCEKILAMNFSNPG